MSNFSLQRLLQYVPPDTFNLANSFLDEIESIRFDSITRHRTITVLPIAMLPEDKYPKKFLPPQQEFIQHVLSRPVLTSREATPTFIQYASLLVNFVHKNIPIFARAMAVRMDKSDSHYLIYSVIPALFGFFISHDHTSRAVEFYKAIMKIIPPEMASEVVQPFFTSVITYRFIESVMYPFIYRFTSDPKIIQQINMKSNLNSSSSNKLQIKPKSKIKTSQSFNDPEKYGIFSYFKRKTRNSFSSDSSFHSVIFSYAKMLCDLIIQSIPLLPVEALELIDMMYQRHWTPLEFNDFFFDHFFNYVSSLYLTASPCLRSDSVFKDVLNCLKTSSLLNLKFFHKAYFEGLTRYEIPPLYSMLDLPYLDFALTIADVAVATNAIENICELPPSLKGISYSKFSKDKFFKMFAVRSFVRKYQVSDLCLTMSPTQLANETKKKKKNQKSEEENKNSDTIYNFDDYDFGGCNSNSYYNLDLDPRKHPRDVDYNNEKFEMVVFNIKRLEVEDNPEFERIFLQEHFSAENEEKSANDITIDLIERIGPDSCNFSSFNTSIQNNNQQQQQQEQGQKEEEKVEKIENNENTLSDIKQTENSDSKDQTDDVDNNNNNKNSSTDFHSIISGFLKNSPSSEDLTIGRLAKEMDSDTKQRKSSEFDVEQIARSQFGGNLINISKMLNENQSVGVITSQNDANNNNGSSKRSKKRFSNKSSFGNVGLEENDDDCFTHDGIANTFKVSQANPVLPIDVDSLTTAIEEEEKETDDKKEMNDQNSLENNDLNLKVYLAKRRANLLIDQSHVFENYIRFRLASDQYSSFTSLLGDLESIICAPLAMNLATFARQLQLTVSDAYRRVEKFFDTFQLKRLIFFIVLSRGPKKCLSNQSIGAVVSKCESAAKLAIEKLLKKFDLSRETNRLQHGESDVFWRSVEALQVMKKDIPVAMQIEAFNYVLGTLRKIEQSIRLRKLKNKDNINKSVQFCKPLNSIWRGNLAGEKNDDLDYESLIFMAFVTSACEILPARYVIFEHFFLLEDSIFTELLGDECKKNWEEFGMFLDSMLHISELENLKNELEKLKELLENFDNSI